MRAEPKPVSKAGHDQQYDFLLSKEEQKALEDANFSLLA